MIKKVGAFALILLCIWVVIDPQAAGAFVRHVGESVVAALRSMAEE